MEKAKEFLWKGIMQDMIKAFDSKEDLQTFVKFYSGKSFDNMKRIASLGYWIRKHVYHMKDERLLGTKTKALPDEIYLKVIPYVRKVWGEKIALALEFEGIEGPRGEDVVRLKLEDFKFSQNIVTIKNRKAGGRTYQIPLNPEIQKEIESFIERNLKQIQDHEGYIFYSGNPVQKRKHISENYLKNVVHKALEDLDLNQIYGYDYLGRARYLYSLHSFRGHAASRVFLKSHGDYKTAQELLDHQDLQTTMLYLEKNNLKDLKKLI